MAFDVKKHLIKVQGGRDYLPVAYRLVWFREEHPDWGIETQPVTIDVEGGVAVFVARIHDTEGRLLSSGTKTETAHGFADYLEKAETGAIGRALGVLGYGTPFAPEFDEGERLADSPMPIGPAPVAPTPSGPPRTNAAAGNIGRDFAICGVCGRPLTNAQRDLSVRKHGRALCPAHQREVAA
jgi:hypothetical protein